MKMCKYHHGKREIGLTIRYFVGEDKDSFLINTSERLLLEKNSPSELCQIINQL